MSYVNDGLNGVDGAVRVILKKKWILFPVPLYLNLLVNNKIVSPKFIVGLVPTTISKMCLFEVLSFNPHVGVVPNKAIVVACI